MKMNKRFQYILFTLLFWSIASESYGQTQNDEDDEMSTDMIIYKDPRIDYLSKIYLNFAL